MSATLTIHIPDDVLARLRQRAAEQGTTPEAVAAAAVERATLPPGTAALPGSPAPSRPT